MSVRRACTTSHFLFPTEMRLSGTEACFVGDNSMQRGCIFARFFTVASFLRGQSGAHHPCKFGRVMKMGVHPQEKKTSFRDSVECSPRVPARSSKR